MIDQTTIANCWRILKEPLSAMDIIKLSPGTDTIKQVMILDIQHNPDRAYIYAGGIKNAAYQILVQQGEIDSTKPFSARTGDYLKDDWRRHDIIYCGGWVNRIDGDMTFTQMYKL